ncbi:hypothetical protein D3C87_1808620 [compost metagenome]
MGSNNLGDEPGMHSGVEFTFGDSGFDKTDDVAESCLIAPNQAYPSVLVAVT